MIFEDSNIYVSDTYVGDTYVCITHRTVLPCNNDGCHLVSNWPVDVEKILDSGLEPRYYTNN